MGLIPSSWMPNCSMKRVIVHWTAGAHKASSIDIAHYHILIEADGKLVRGSHSIFDNVSTADNVYAAHTFQLNRGSIGVSVCCMAGARETPFNPGSFPMTQIQWETMGLVVAELCQEYEIEVTPQTVLGHGEVTRILGIDQGGKWDPMVLPWNTNLSDTEVGDAFRRAVKENLATFSPRSEGRDETPASIKAIVNGKTFREAQIFNEKSVIKLRPLVEEFNWTILHANLDVVELHGFSSELHSPASAPYKLISQSNMIVTPPADSSEGDIVDLLNKFGFVSAADIGSILNLDVTWDGSERTVIIG